MAGIFQDSNQLGSSPFTTVTKENKEIEFAPTNRLLVFNMIFK